MNHTQGSQQIEMVSTLMLYYATSSSACFHSLSSHFGMRVLSHGFHILFKKCSCNIFPLNIPSHKFHSKAIKINCTQHSSPWTKHYLIIMGIFVQIACCITWQLSDKKKKQQEIRLSLTLYLVEEKQPGRSRRGRRNCKIMFSSFLMKE